MTKTETTSISSDLTAQRIATYDAILSQAANADSRGDTVARQQLRRDADEYYATRLGADGRRIVDARR